MQGTPTMAHNREYKGHHNLHRLSIASYPLSLIRFCSIIISIEGCMNRNQIVAKNSPRKILL